MRLWARSWLLSNQPRATTAAPGQSVERRRRARAAAPAAPSTTAAVVAGGLPVAGSEPVCLALVAFALEAGLQLGVHYCSLENKHTGQVFRQNASQPLPATYAFSERDYFWKTVKAYGADISRVRRALRGQPAGLRRASDDGTCLELHPSQVAALRAAGLDVELGLSFNILEARADGQYLRELKLALIRPATFDCEHDV